MKGFVFKKPDKRTFLHVGVALLAAVVMSFCFTSVKWNVWVESVFIISTITAAGYWWEARQVRINPRLKKDIQDILTATITASFICWVWYGLLH